MTDQMFVFLCKDVRKHAFDYRRDEMQAAEQRKLQDHVAHCEKCRDYLDRLEGMLDAAAVHEVSPTLDRDELFSRIVDEARSEEPERLDRDQLFDRITGELEPVPSAPPVSAEALELAQPRETVEADREGERPDKRPIALYVVAALAAGILIGIGLSFLYPLDPTPPVRGEIAQQPPALDSPPEGAAPLPLHELTMQPTPAEFSDVRVFGEAHANWQIRTQGTRRKLDLQQGTVLVEFVPRNAHELEFVTEEFTVRVTGTVFYASAERGIVGVVVGSVEVATKEGETIALTDGQEWVAGKGVRRAAADVRPEVQRHIDLVEHQRVLTVRAAQKEVAADAPPSNEAPRPPSSTEVKRTPRHELRAAADRALREGRHDIAAQFYERMVEELSAADPANASLRLDLARIYVQHLGQQRRALVHLRRFVTDRPHDSLTPNARTELCRIAAEVDADEPQCAQ